MNTVEDNLSRTNTRREGVVDTAVFNPWMTWLSHPPTVQPFPNWILGCRMEGGDWLSKLRRLAWRKADRPFQIPWLNGLRVRVDGEDELLKSLFLTGLFEPNEFLVLQRLLQPGMTFVDIGANLGLYSLFAAKKIGRLGTVLAFEPSSREFKKLQHNVSLNGLSQVRLFNFALSDYAGETKLLIADEAHSGHNTIGAFCYQTNLADTESIRLETFDSVRQRENLGEIDVVKMDVEGGELFALRGMRQTLEQCRPVLFLEMSDPAAQPQGSSSAQVWEFLTALGYNFFAFDESSGLPVRASLKPQYVGENLIAVHASRGTPEWLWESGRDATAS